MNNQFSLILRPNNINNVVGHKLIKNELKNRLKNEDFSQVVLFEGITGTGKTTLTKILSKSILCQSKDNNGNACNECFICKTVDENKPNLGFYLEENGSNLSIDRLREIEEGLNNSMAMSPVKKRVVIFDEIQEIANQRIMKNILKMLENKYTDTYFILGTMDSSKISDAILNRSVKYHLKPIGDEDIYLALKDVCGGLGVELDENKKQVLKTLSESSDGSMRTAISYLERVVKSEIWDETELCGELNLVSNDSLIKIVNGVLTGNFKGLNLYQVDNKILDRIKEIFLNLYKRECGLYLPKKGVELIKKVVKPKSVVFLQNVLDRLFETQKYVYLTNSFIAYTLISCSKEYNEKIDNNPPKKVVLKEQSIENDYEYIKQTETPENSQDSVQMLKFLKEELKGDIKNEPKRRRRVIVEN